MDDTFISADLSDVVYVAMGQGRHWQVEDGNVVRFPGIKVSRIDGGLAITHYHVSHGPTDDRVIYPMAQVPAEYHRMLGSRSRKAKRLAEGIADKLADEIAADILAELGESV